MKRPSVQGTVRLTGFVEEAMAAGMEAKAKVLDARQIKADWKEAEQLQVQPGDPIWCIKRVRSIKGTPYAYVVSYLPDEIGRRMTERDFSASMLKALEQQGRGPMGEAAAVITAALADPHVGSLLSVPVGAALLSIESTFYDAGGRAVQYVRGLYRSDMYGYAVRLVREGEGQHWYYSIAPRPSER
jgi:GntR family transcriptional regulator